MEKYVNVLCALLAALGCAVVLTAWWALLRSWWYL